MPAAQLLPDVFGAEAGTGMRCGSGLLRDDSSSAFCVATAILRCSISSIRHRYACNRCGQLIFRLRFDRPFRGAQLARTVEGGFDPGPEIGNVIGRGQIEVAVCRLALPQ